MIGTVIDVGDHVFLNGGVFFRDKPLSTQVPFIVINIAGVFGGDTILVVREAAYYAMLVADGHSLDVTHGIFLSLNDVARRVKADA